MKCGNSFDQSAVRRVIGRRCHFKVVGVRHWLFWRSGWALAVDVTSRWSACAIGCSGLAGHVRRVGDGAMPTMSLQGGRRVLLVVLGEWRHAGYLTSRWLSSAVSCSLALRSVVLQTIKGDGAMPTMSLQGGRRVLLVVLLAAGQSWGWRNAGDVTSRWSSSAV